MTALPIPDIQALQAVGVPRWRRCSRRRGVAGGRPFLTSNFYRSVAMERAPQLPGTATDGGGARRYRIVGTVAFPILNYTDYDNGLWLTHKGLWGVQVGQGNAVVPIRLASVPGDAAKRSELEEIGFDFENTGAPAKVANLDEAKGFPQALAAFLATLGLVTVGHALASSPRRRRRDFAVLRTLGFVRRQLGATLTVQATAVTAFGLPIGIATGRTAWSGVATGLSAVGRPVVPSSVLLAPPSPSWSPT